MSEAQKAIIKKAEQIVSSFNILFILLNSLIYTAILFIGFIVLKIDPDWVTIAIVFVLLVAYFFLKDFVLYKQAKKSIQSQYAFLIAKHPHLTLFIPIIGKNGTMLFMKRAALYIDGDSLYLEAFDQKAFKSTPTKSISMPHGDDFTIKDIVHDKRKPYYLVSSTIKEHNYDFIIPDDENVIASVNAKIDNIEKEVA